MIIKILLCGHALLTLPKSILTWIIYVPVFTWVKCVTFFVDRKEHEKCEFELHEVYAIDVLVSTGEGKVIIFFFYFIKLKKVQTTTVDFGFSWTTHMFLIVLFCDLNPL